MAARARRARGAVASATAIAEISTLQFGCVASRDTSTVELMWWSTLACTVVLLPVTLATGEPFWPQSVRGWAVLIAMALISQVAGQGLIAWAMAHLPASFSSVSLLVQPVAAALLAWILLSEPFGALQALGGAVVLAGIVICRMASIRRQ